MQLISKINQVQILKSAYLTNRANQGNFLYIYKIPNMALKQIESLWIQVTKNSSKMCVF